MALMRTGTYMAASRLLVEADPPLTVSYETIRQWSQPGGRHYARWLELNERYAPEVEQEAVNRARRIVQRLQDAQEQALDRFDAEKIEQAKLPEAMRNLATTQALHIDKTILPLTGRDIAARQERSYDELVKALKSALPAHVDAEAVVESEEPAEAGPKRLNPAEA